MCIHVYVFMAIDIDECAENISRCNQECNNTLGSFQCSCQDGYQLGLDERTCTGMKLILCAKHHQG